MTRAVRRAGLAVLLVFACGTAMSGATFTESTVNDQVFTAVADFGLYVTMNDPTSPRRGTVQLSASPTVTTGDTIAEVVIQRSPAGGNTWTPVCTLNAPPYQCDWVTSGSGTYDLRARATNQNGYSKTSNVVANRLIDNDPPTVTMDPVDDWNAGTILLESSPADTGGSALARVEYEYRTSPAGTWSPACTSSTAPYSCNFDTSAMTDGQNYDFRAKAVDGAGNATDSPVIANRRADNTDPGGAMTDPGTNMRGTKSLGSAPTDGQSGVASVTMEYSPTGTSTWSTACVALAPATSCNWDTTAVTSQMYDFRAVVRDVPGNTFTTAAFVNRRVDNIGPTMGLTVTPASGTITGNVTFNASATDNAGGSGVQEVRIQYSVADANTWTTACGPYTPPTAASCTVSSAGVPDDVYDFRAVGLDVAGNSDYAYNLNRRVDNANPTALDLYTTDVGGTPGRIQVGDSLTLTYSEEIDPATLVAGWNGQTAVSMYARLNHAGAGDRFLFYTNVGLTTAIPLAAGNGVSLNADFVGNTGATLPATLTRSADGESYTVAFTSVTGVNTAPTAVAAAANMAWTTSNVARDMVAKPVVAATRTESGGATPDRDF